MNLQSIEKAGLNLVSGIVNGRFVAQTESGFVICRFDPKSKHGIRIGKQLHESLPDIGVPTDARPVLEPSEPTESVEPCTSNPADKATAGVAAMVATLLATAQTPASDAPSLTASDMVAKRGAIRAWLRNSQWRVGSHLHGESFVLSRPNLRRWMTRDWYIATLRAGVVSLASEPLESRDDALRELGAAPVSVRLDGLPSLPYRLP